MMAVKSPRGQLPSVDILCGGFPISMSRAVMSPAVGEGAPELRRTAEVRDRTGVKLLNPPAVVSPGARGLVGSKGRSL
jgi:hypothetical protein